MSFQGRQGRALDYQPCQYGSSKLLVRGPRRRLKSDCIAFLGGTETFGKFMAEPYPALVEAETGVMSLNLGAMNAGVDAYYNSPGLIDICSMARITVIQIMGAINMSNRYYTVDARHNDRFLRASATLKMLYDDVDFSEFHHTTHMLTALAQSSREKFELVQNEVQTAWVARMTSLIEQIGGHVVLLWLSDHPPKPGAGGGTVLREPLFVNASMLEAVRTPSTRLVEVIATADEIGAGLDQMVFDAPDQTAARQMLGPVVHARAAEALVPLLQDLL